MMDKTIEERVKKLIVEHLNASEDLVTPSAHFVNDLSADSLDIIELVMAMEEEFGIEIPDDKSEKIQTVADAIQYIESQSPNSKNIELE